MEALPKGEAKEFHEKEYWKNFYKQEDIVKQHGFEWYANYEEVKEMVDANFKQNNKDLEKKDAKILVPGCGDSKLGHHMRLDGYGHVTNIDFEEEVITRMNIEAGVPGVEDYLKMDILDMKDITDKTMDIVIDKGTVDALYSGKDNRDEVKVSQYFNEAMRVLKPNSGQFVMISLLQSHILKKIIKFFLTNEDGDNKFHDNSIVEVKVQEIFIKSRTNKIEAHFIGHRVPFLVTIKRTEFDGSNDKMKSFKTNFEKMVNVNGNLLTHANTRNEIILTQMLNLEYGNIKELSQGRITEVNMESTSPDDDNKLARFKLILVDTEDKETLENNNCAILIVPQGKEVYPIYSSEAGYRELSEKVGHSRLIIVHLKSGHHFESFDSVKKELESTIVRFAQKGYSNDIPYVSEEKKIGNRRMIGKKYHVVKEDEKVDEDAKDEFEYADTYIIEDRMEEAEDANNQYIVRELKYKARRTEVQSDVVIRRKRTKDKKKDFSKFCKVRSPLWDTKDDEFLYIDHTYLNSDYLSAMAAGMAIYYGMFQEEKKEKKANFLVLGTGAGILPMFLYKTMHPMIGRLNTVDIDEEIVAIGKDYYGFDTEIAKNFRSEICDAKEYLKNEAVPGKTNALFIDIATAEEGESVIPPDFVLTDDFFDDVFKALNSDHHVVLLNTCCYSEAKRHEINKLLNSKFKFVSYMKATDAFNRVYVLSNTHAPSLAKTPENTIKHFIKTFCDATSADSHDWGMRMDMKGLIANIKYGEGNKAEVQVEQVESTEAPKKKKPKKK